MQMVISLIVSCSLVVVTSTVGSLNVGWLITYSWTSAAGSETAVLSVTGTWPAGPLAAFPSVGKLINMEWGRLNIKVPVRVVEDSGTNR
jgi:hypothetical protein